MLNSQFGCLGNKADQSRLSIIRNEFDFDSILVSILICESPCVKDTKSREAAQRGFGSVYRSIAGAFGLAANDCIVLRVYAQFK